MNVSQRLEELAQKRAQLTGIKVEEAAAQLQVEFSWLATIGGPEEALEVLSELEPGESVTSRVDVVNLRLITKKNP